MKNVLKKIIKILLLTIPVIVIIFCICNNILNKDIKWLKQGHLVAHAFGDYNGKTYTNSLEAFNLNYEKGHRLFEVDFQFTSDDVLISLHDRNTPIKTFEQEQEKVKYTLLTFEDICDLMLTYPDIIIITDIKYYFSPEMQSKVFNYMEKIIEKKSPSLYKRIIVQVYNQSMYYLLKDNYQFDSYIYTLYASSDTDQEVIDFIKKEKIKVVAMWEYRAKQQDFVKQLKDNNVYIFVHTINNTEIAQELMNGGVYGIYTDLITYNDLGYNITQRYIDFKYNHLKNRIKK